MRLRFDARTAPTNMFMLFGNSHDKSSRTSCECIATQIRVRLCAHLLCAKAATGCYLRISMSSHSLLGNPLRWTGSVASIDGALFGSHSTEWRVLERNWFVCWSNWFSGLPIYRWLNYLVGFYELSLKKCKYVFR